MIERKKSKQSQRLENFNFTRHQVCNFVIKKRRFEISQIGVDYSFRKYYFWKALMKSSNLVWKFSNPVEKYVLKDTSVLSLNFR